MLLRRNRLLVGTVLSLLLCFSLIISVKAEASMWAQTYNRATSDRAYSLVETSDGGYALAGHSYEIGSSDLGDCWLVKTDEHGDVEWNMTYGGLGDDWASSLIETSDGGYALAGHTSSFGAGNDDFWLIKTDASGNMVWNKTYGGEMADWAESLIATSDGGYAIAGVCNCSINHILNDYYFDYYVNGDFWLVKTDAAGNMEWNQTYGGAYFEVAYSLAATSDGGYALAGCTALDYERGDFWLVKTDAAGNMEWNQTYGETRNEGAYFEEAYSLVATSDGGYALAGRTAFGYYLGDGDCWLVKTDEYGNAEWNQTHGGLGDDWAYSLIATSDGGYAIAGKWNSTDWRGLDYGEWPNSNCWLVKTDSAGNMEWNQTYGGEKVEVASSLVEASDGGYAITGYTITFGSDGADFLLIKTDENGVAPLIPEVAWVILPLLLVATSAIFIGNKMLRTRSS